MATVAIYFDGAEHTNEQGLSIMRHRIFNVWLCILGAAVPFSVSAGEIDVSAWSHQTSVRIGAGGIADGTTSVSNPLMSDFQTSLQNSTAFSVVASFWDSNEFSLRVEGDHSCQGGSSVFCRSSGTIFFSVPVVSSFTAAGEYNYSLAGGARFALLQVSLGTDEGSPMVIVNDVFDRSNINGPPTGQITYQSTPAMLEAGVAYALQYRLELAAFSGSPTALSVADGFIDMSIAPIPEPTTCAMLAVTTPFVLRRRRFCCDGRN